MNRLSAKGRHTVIAACSALLILIVFAAAASMSRQKEPRRISQNAEQPLLLKNAYGDFQATHPDVAAFEEPWNGEYEKTIEYVNNLKMEDRVFLLLSVSNPFPIVKACDAFILSSFYEGFGLVLAEADILGLPVVSTDISGPRDFMRDNGGTMVESSEEGIYQGLCLLGDGLVKPMEIDYEAYNRKAIAEFEALFD